MSEKEWREHTVAHLSTRIAMGPFGSNIKAENFENKGVPVIRGSNLNYSKYVSGDFVYLTENKAHTLQNSICHPDDIVITHRGTLGQVCLVPQGKFREYVVSQSGMFFSVNKEIADSDFIFYYFKSSIGQFEILKNESQVGVPSISNPLTSLKKATVLLPPLPEQKAIAEVLSSLDDKIDLLTRQNTTLEALVQTYFRQWFLEETDNDPIKVSDIAKLDNNSVNPSRKPLEPFYHYSIPAYDNAQTPVIELGKTILSNKFAVQPNSILVSKLNPITPRIWRIGGNVMPNSVCSTEFQVLRPLNIRHYLFLYCLMKSNNVVSSFAMSASGTSGSHQRIRPEYILEVETPEPDDDKLIFFNDLCTPMMEQVKKNQKQILTLQKLRDTLLPKLISGEVRVKR